MRRRITTIALAIVASASLTAGPAMAKSPWHRVPNAIVQQFAEDGIALSSKCRIRYGDTTVIRCGSKRYTS